MASADDWSSQSTSSRWSHDVFLSFCDEDTGRNFTDHLYFALAGAGIRTFRYDEHIPAGEAIFPAIVRAIRGSRTSVIVFSKGYAPSPRCLDELVEILECRRTKKQQVFPVFYDVDPSDVRKQTASYGKAFDETNSVKKVKSWRNALSEVGNLSGWDLQCVAHGHQAKFIQKITEKISREVSNTHLHISRYTVGMNCRVHRLMMMLQPATLATRVIGIYGMGGIGKTTLAKVIYNKIFSDFDGSCFLSNIRSETADENPNSFVSLQLSLLSQILRREMYENIDYVDRGINLIRERLCSKRVLIVLDDLDNINQLYSLVGDDMEWFAPGSRIILTTRDEHLLNEIGNCEKYKVERLCKEESTELFSWHAFGKSSPMDNFTNLSKYMVFYANGLPLALKVLGSHLCGRNKLEWKSVMNQLKKAPHDRIYQMLKISFDALDENAQQIFLDISFFFIGMSELLAKVILDNRGFAAEIGMSVLKERCLLMGKDKLEMHDLVRDMGREIVRRESPNPAKRSRLWNCQDILNVLNKDKGSEKIQGIKLAKPMYIDTKTLSRMQNLKLLQMDHAHIPGKFELILPELVWLQWKYCPLAYLPSTFNLEKLAVLNMEGSKIKVFEPSIKALRSLKILNLSGSKHLQKSPNFTDATSLQVLNLSYCRSLQEIQSSIGNLKSLKELNLDGCTSMRQLPSELGELKCLESLQFFGIHLPDRFGTLDKNDECSTSTEERSFKRSTVNESWVSHSIPSWMCRNQRSRMIRSSEFLPHSMSALSSLKFLYMSSCNLDDADIGVNIGRLSSLGTLYMGGNSFCRVPLGLSRLSRVTSLYLDNCKNIEEIVELPPNLQQLSAFSCPSLQKLPHLSSYKKLQSLDVSFCSSLVEIDGLENLLCMTIVGCTNLARPSLVDGNFFKEYTVPIRKHICSSIPKDQYSKWSSSRQINQSSCDKEFYLVVHQDRTFLGLLIWIVCSVFSNDRIEIVTAVKTSEESLEVIHAYHHTGDQEFILFCLYSPRGTNLASKLECGDAVRLKSLIRSQYSRRAKIIKCGIRALYATHIGGGQNRIQG